VNFDVFWGIFAKILSENILLSNLVALQVSGFNHGNGGKNRKQDTPARNLTIIAKSFRQWFVWVGEAITIQVGTGSEGSRSYRLPEFLDNRLSNMARLLALCNGCLYPPRKYPWYSLVLEAELTPGP
jgi:hypothetical protein